MNGPVERRRWAIRVGWLLAAPGLVMLAAALLVLLELPALAGCATNVLSTRLVMCPDALTVAVLEPIARLGWSTLVFLPAGTFAPMLYAIGFVIWRLIRRRG